MKQLLLKILVLSLFACNEDIKDCPPYLPDAKVIVLNEGNFNFGNASISVYSETDKTVNQKVFQSANSGRPIGDVVQSAVQYGNELFVVVNNSSKIEVLDASKFEAKGSIQQLNSPRYIQIASPNKAYVSDLYEDELYVLDLPSKVVVKTIEISGWVEEMAIVNNKLYCAHVDSNQVWVVDVVSDSILTKIDVGIQPQFIEVDVNNKVWVSCTGGFSGDKSSLHQIDATSDSVITVFQAATADDKIGEIEMNGAKDELFYLGKEGLYQMSISSNQLPFAASIAQNNRLFYGVSIHPSTDEIYITDAIDYQQRGVVYRYSKQFTQLDAFKVGIIPGDILFLN